MIRALLFVVLIGCGSERAPEPVAPSPDRPVPVAIQVDAAAPQTPVEKLLADMEAVHKETEALQAATTAIIATVDAAQTDPDRAAARATLESLIAQPPVLIAKLDALVVRARELYQQDGATTDHMRTVRYAWDESAGDRPRLANVKEDLEKTTDKLTAAQSAADRADAMARLNKLREEKAEMERRIKEAGAKAKKPK